MTIDPINVAMGGSWKHNVGGRNAMLLVTRGSFCKNKQAYLIEVSNSDLEDDDELMEKIKIFIQIVGTQEP